MALKKKKNKKNRLKIFIALSLMITCVFGVMFATNTFAKTDINDDTYYDFNQLIRNGNFANSSNWNTADSTLSIINNKATINMNSNSTFSGLYQAQTLINGNKYFVSCNATNKNANIRQFSVGQPYTNISVSLEPNIKTLVSGIINAYVPDTTLNRNCIMYGNRQGLGTNLTFEIEDTMCINLTQMFGEGNEPTTINELKTYFNILDINLEEYQRYTTSKYLYISNNSNTEYQQLTNDYDEINENYNQLLEDYEDLEMHYENLDENYEDLEEQYNDLNENYENLETNYEDLDNKLKNLYFNTNYGIWDFLAYEDIAIFNPNYSSTDEYYRYEGITNWVKYNSILEMNKLNITNAITRYWSSTNTPPYSINCDSWAITMNFSVPNNVNYIYYEMPLDVLDLFIDTNISFNNIVVNENVNDYLIINIRLSNYDNYSYDNFIDLDISRDFLDEYGFKITKDNLQQYFSQYDLNYYNNIMSITIGSNYQLSTNDKFNIISSNAVIDRNYQLGFIDGQASMDNTITGLKVQISDLKGTISQLELVINTLNGQVDTLTNGYDLNNLMWTIGSVPFESFKQIWNVNFFGVNLADFFLGFVTFFVALFVVKKFFL